ncbi:MAG: aminopeptidase [Saprospiraceae bacterium]
MNPIYQKYADLLVNYCMEIKPDDKLYISTTTLAEPLVREVYRLSLRAGATVEVDLDFREKSKIFYEEAHLDSQLNHVPMQYAKAMAEFDAYLFIKAPFNTRESKPGDLQKVEKQKAVLSPFSKKYFERAATRSLKRNFCLFPTLASAQEAAMSMEDYEHFVFNACKLFEPDPIAAWLNVRKEQQGIVDVLNAAQQVRYIGPKTDISFRTDGRKWINSDGQTNMPSGEVYTSPVEDSVNGVVHFDYPCLYQGNEVQDVTLYVKDGYIEKWEAASGKDYLDYIFSLEGTRRFGEAAIGTNYGIDRMTKNILFDEKIGGTIHMAIGQSYPQCGGKNESVVHWDMISDMTKGGQIIANDQLIYENGKFLIS